MRRKLGFAGAAVAAVLFIPPLPAGQTRVWTQGEAADYEKGVLKGVSLRSDGRLALAPVTREVFDTSSGYLWALARDSKGNLYAGGGTGAKLFRIGADGKGKAIADLEALEIHAIAVDARDRVYAATSPDGKIYRIDGNAKPAVFYDPKSKYIWAMAFDAAGDLFVATGDRGEIHRVTPDGKGQVFYRTEETHVRSLAIDGKGNLIAGTEPGGLVIRIPAAGAVAGDGLVLYQMSKREVTAVAVAPDGSVYAAGVGVKSAPVSAPAPSAPPPAPPQTAGGLAAPRPTPAPPLLVVPAGVAGGSEVYRIAADSAQRKMWSHAQDVVYAIAFDAAGHVLVGAGNRGNVYRIESPVLYTSLVNLPATQVTAFLAGADGRLWAATGNTGKVYEIGPGLEREGTVESEVFDAGGHTLWGRVSFEAILNGGRVSIATRSGNLDQPQKGWSAWTEGAANPKGGRVVSPAARFVQWKAALYGDGVKSPELDSVDVAYLPKNVEPHVDQIETTPANYRFPASVTQLAVLTPTLVLPPIGRRGTGSGISPDSTPAMQWAKGYIGVRWAASDPNGDALVFTVEIKGASESEWKPLKEKVPEKYLTWDSTAFPDGEYRVRVTASDAPGNPPSEALTASAESPPFWIDNTPPRITGLSASRAGGRLQVKWHAADALNNLAKCEYSLDGGEWKVAAPVTRLSDAPELDYVLGIDAGAGEHTIAVRVEDEYANQAVEKAVVK